MQQKNSIPCVFSCPARDAVLLKNVSRTVPRHPRTVFREVALVVRGLPAHDASGLQPAALAARPRGALRLLRQLAGDGVAARVDLRALVNGAAVAVFAILHHPIAAGPSHLKSRKKLILRIFKLLNFMTYEVVYLCHCISQCRGPRLQF